MSEEEDDYNNSSDESSVNEETYKKNAPNDGKPRILSLEDNEEDDRVFQRPDMIDVYEEGEEEGESDGDIIEEDDTLELDADGKPKKKTSLLKKNSNRLYNGKPVLPRNSNATSRADSEEQKNKKKKKVKK